MMDDVDALTISFVPLLDKNLAITDILILRYQLQHPKACIAATFTSINTSKIIYLQDIIRLTVLTKTFIEAFKVTQLKKLNGNNCLFPD